MLEVFRLGTSTQVTTFDGVNQTISGNGTNVTNFANLVIVSSGTVSLASTTTTLQVNNKLTLNSGILAGGSNTVYVIGDIYNKASHTSSSVAGGLNLKGITAQNISGDGNGSIGNVIVNNANGINLKDNATINGQLTFTNGRIYIDDYLLTLGQNSTIGGIPTVNKMIMLNGALSDQGVRKLFPAGATAAFTIPIGVAGKYTPAIYTINATSTAGGITVRPVNSDHSATDRCFW